MEDLLQWFSGWSRGLPLEQQPTNEMWVAQLNDLRRAIAAALLMERIVGHDKGVGCIGGDWCYALKWRAQADALEER